MPAIRDSAQVQIAAGQTISAGDSGDAVFNQIKTGNGTFTVAATATNTGSGLIGASTVSNPALYAGGTYSINFTAANTYQVLNSASAVVTSGTYTSGQAISFDGLQVTLSGQPATAIHLPAAQHPPKHVYDGTRPRQRLAAGVNHTRLSNAI